MRAPRLWRRHRAGRAQDYQHSTRTRTSTWTVCCHRRRHSIHRPQENVTPPVKRWIGPAPHPARQLSLSLSLSLPLSLSRLVPPGGTFKTAGRNRCLGCGSVALSEICLLFLLCSSLSSCRLSRCSALVRHSLEQSLLQLIPLIIARGSHARIPPLWRQGQQPLWRTRESAPLLSPVLLHVHIECMFLFRAFLLHLAVETQVCKAALASPLTCAPLMTARPRRRVSQL